MQHQFSIGVYEKHIVTMNYDQFWGRFEIHVDNMAAVSKLFLFDFSLTRTFDIWVGIQEKHHVRIEKTRQLFFAAFNPQHYRIFIDGVMVQEFDS